MFEVEPVAYQQGSSYSTAHSQSCGPPRPDIFLSVHARDFRHEKESAGDWLEVNAFVDPENSPGNAPRARSRLKDYSRSSGCSPR